VGVEEYLPMDLGASRLLFMTSLKASQLVLVMATIVGPVWEFWALLGHADPL
jgi:hypothetical protein